MEMLLFVCIVSFWWGTVNVCIGIPLMDDANLWEIIFAVHAHVCVCVCRVSCVWMSVCSTFLTNHFNGSWEGVHLVFCQRSHIAHMKMKSLSWDATYVRTYAALCVCVCVCARANAVWTYMAGPLLWHGSKGGERGRDARVALNYCRRMESLWWADEWRRSRLKIIFAVHVRVFVCVCVWERMCVCVERFSWIVWKSVGVHLECHCRPLPKVRCGSN